ncbi:MAG TPA: TULIP family P47-like protein, partial [Vicinamibacterales bacterium]|nr:TULIP family P47-like protein [Vicinamibacterales bacterium]
HSSPTGFTYSDTYSPIDGVNIPYTVKVGFGDWQVTTGGDGKNIRLSLPLLNATLEFTQTGKTFSFSTGTATIEVQLHYIAHAAAGGATSCKLVVKTVADSQDSPVVCLVTSSYEGNPSTVQKALIDSALCTWCNANLAQFTHVFAAIDLNSTIDQNQWGFAAPNYTSYAYLDKDNLDDSLFAVLCMTGDRTGENLPQHIDPNSIPTGSAGGFLVSQQRTLADLLRPAICAAYSGLTTGNFVLSSDRTTLSLRDGVTINLPAVSQSGTSYYPVLKQMSVKANGQTLQLDSYTETVIDPFYGITAACTASHWYTLGLGTSSNGQTLVFQQAQAPSIVHSIQQSADGAKREEIIAIVAGIALLILGILTDGAAFVASGLIVGLALGANQIAPGVIEQINQNDSPSIDLLLVNSVKPIQWTGSKTFTLDYASLNVSLQLGGNPNFA